MQKPRTMERPAPSCTLVNILAKQPAVLIPAVMRLSWPVFLAYITKPTFGTKQGSTEVTVKDCSYTL